MDKYINVKDLEEAAILLLPKPARDYYRSGATEELTLADNRRAFQR
jgi:isopentenyl diphosphate isomerase/L-lactate dehydrogenase-like FMN-dependent dehydrogenase